MLYREHRVRINFRRSIIYPILTRTHTLSPSPFIALSISLFVSRAYTLEHNCVNIFCVTLSFLCIKTTSRCAIELKINFYDCIIFGGFFSILKSTVEYLERIRFQNFCIHIPFTSCQGIILWSNGDRRQRNE